MDILTRVDETKVRFEASLKKYWWGTPVIIVCGLIYALLEHRLMETLNRFIDQHVTFSWVRPAVQTIQYSSYFHPLIVIAELFAIFISLLLVHAYLETRRGADPNRPRLALWAPSPDGTAAFWRQYAYVFKLKNVGERAARAIRFDPIFSQPGSYELRFDEVSALVKNEDTPLGITVSFDGYTLGKVSEEQRNDPFALRQFLTQDLPNDKTLKFEIVAKFHDTNDSVLEEHIEMECRMPGMYIKFRPVPMGRRRL